MNTSLSSYFKVGQGGIVIPDISSIKNNITKDFTDYIFSSQNGVIDTTEESIVGRLIEYLSSVVSDVLNISAQTINQFNINYAGGMALDAIGSWFGIDRKDGIATIVYANITGSANLNITKGFKISINGNAFYLTEDIVLNSNGLATGVFESEDSKRISITYNDEIKIESILEGINTISLTNIIYGQDVESDDSLRDRIKSTSWMGTSFIGTMRNAISSIDGVSKVSILENYTSSNNIDINGVLLPAHSIFVCVLGGDDNEVAKAIFDSKSAGCGYLQSISNNNNGVVVDIVNEESPVANKVYFFRPVIKEIPGISVVAYNKTSYMSSQEIEDTIKSLILSYINEKISIGDSISTIQLAAHIQSLLSGVYVSDIVFSVSGGGTTSSISSTGAELITATIDNISVTISNG